MRGKAPCLPADAHLVALLGKGAAGGTARPGLRVTRGRRGDRHSHYRQAGDGSREDERTRENHRGKMAVLLG